MNTTKRAPTKKASKVDIRGYKSEDKKAVIGLMEEFNDRMEELDPHKLYGRRSGFAEQWLGEIQKDVAEKNGIFNVAVKNNEVVGFIYAVVHKKEVNHINMDDITVGDINVVAVSKHHEGEGIGSQLMDSAEKRLKDIGCNIIVLSYNVNNHKAAEWYARRGYEVRSVSRLKYL